MPSTFDTLTQDPIRVPMSTTYKKVKHPYDALVSFDGATPEQIVRWAAERQAASTRAAVGETGAKEIAVRAVDVGNRKRDEKRALARNATNLARAQGREAALAAIEEQRRAIEAMDDDA